MRIQERTLPYRPMACMRRGQEERHGRAGRPAQAQERAFQAGLRRQEGRRGCGRSHGGGQRHRRRNPGAGGTGEGPRSRDGDPGAVLPQHTGRGRSQGEGRIRQRRAARMGGEACVRLRTQASLGSPRGRARLRSRRQDRRIQLHPAPGMGCEASADPHLLDAGPPFGFGNGGDLAALPRVRRQHDGHGSSRSWATTCTPCRETGCT